MSFSMTSGSVSRPKHVQMNAEGTVESKRTAFCTPLNVKVLTRVVTTRKKPRYCSNAILMMTNRPNISRRALLHGISLLPLSFLQPAFSQSDEIIFTKVPSCPEPSCPAVEIHDYRIGKGRLVENGTKITFKWTGRLADRYGWPIQNETADEVSFVLGRDKLIQGFEIAIQGMREGGKRRMVIPGELGYKDEVAGPLPATYGDKRRLFATVLNPRRFKKAGDLVIDVQLIRVRTPR